MPKTRATNSGSPRQPRPSASPPDRPFWQAKPLAEMNAVEWESLCDGCGRCCMLKIEDEDTGEVHLTRLSCKLLDLGSCRCKDYPNRHAEVPDCLKLDLAKVQSLAWLPHTCAYRALSEGRDLAWWHPLVSGDPETVHQAGISVRDWATPESPAKLRAMERYLIVDWEEIDQVGET